MFCHDCCNADTVDIMIWGLLAYAIDYLYKYMHIVIIDSVLDVSLRILNSPEEKLLYHNVWTDDVALFAHIYMNIQIVYGTAPNYLCNAI